MQNRKWKYLMLAAAGGVLLQAVGCGQLLAETLISNVIPLIISQILASAVTGATT